MSNKVLTPVLHHSNASGTALLVMIAIADVADDDGFAWPGNEDLGRKARTTPRNARRVVSQLENPDEGTPELLVARRRGCANRYLVCGLPGLIALEDAEQTLRAKLAGDTRVHDLDEWEIGPAGEDLDDLLEPSDGSVRPSDTEDKMSSPTQDTTSSPDDTDRGADQGQDVRGTEDEMSSDQGHPRPPSEDIAVSSEPSRTPRDPSTTSDEVGVATSPPTAQDLLADHIDNCNTRPPDRVVGQTAREIAQLLDEGIEPEAIRAGLAKLRRKALHPSTLASLVNEVLNAPTADRPREKVGTFDETRRF